MDRIVFELALTIGGLSAVGAFAGTMCWHAAAALCRRLARGHDEWEGLR